MSKMRIKTGDTVVVISGKEKGKTGKVSAVNPTKQTVTIEGVNMVKCHTKPRSQTDLGGIVEKEAAIRVCKVALLDPTTKKPTRIGYKIDGDKKVRISKKTGKEI